MMNDRKCEENINKFFYNSSAIKKKLSKQGKMTPKMENQTNKLLKETRKSWLEKEV